MKKFYHLGAALKRSCIEILPDREIEGDFLKIFLNSGIPSTKDRLSDSLVFHIEARKKEFDIILAYNCWTNKYYSKELISILNQFTDMSDRCYKINLPDATKEYFIIYNLKCYNLINRKELNAYHFLSLLPELPPLRFVLGKENLGPVFSVTTTACIVISEEIMKAIKKAKLTNVEFKDVYYAYTPEEALEWAKENPQFADDFADEEWFRELLKK